MDGTRESDTRYHSLAGGQTWLPARAHPGLKGTKTMKRRPQAEKAVLGGIHFVPMGHYWQRMAPMVFPERQ
jgi:hypothetical protein